MLKIKIMFKILVKNWKILDKYCSNNNFPLYGLLGEIIGAILFILLIWWLIY